MNGSDVLWGALISLIILIGALGFYEWNRRAIMRRFRGDRKDG